MLAKNYHGKYKIDIDEILSKLIKYEGVKGYAIISRDGILGINSLPPETHGETVAIMAATMYGGAITQQSELRKDGSPCIRIESDDGLSLIISTGKESILLVTGDKKLEERVKEVREIAEELSTIPD